ncbi:YlzJ-like family protein [Calidifontibacillus oryziterrae]|uniref:YlzJ-like family protein n=1 Tax=Calidifontibacillus oryziterrae TaxID=1191699 RepID=UPI00031865CB|nr:YlzJ-like family protein [Calidifontibacillus oryziterrae]
MIMYTTMPHELIFQENESVFSKRKMMNVNGISLIVEPLSQEECRVVQVLSTNPYDFLYEAYSPGSILSIKPQFY